MLLMPVLQHHNKNYPGRPLGGTIRRNRITIEGGVGLSFLPFRELVPQNYDVGVDLISQAQNDPTVGIFWS